MHLSSFELLFDRLFYGVLDIVFLVLNIMAYRAVRGTRWQVHLGWIVPFIYQSALQLVYWTIWNTHSFLGLSLPDGLYHLARICLYISDVVGVYGMVILVRTLRQMVSENWPGLAEIAAEQVSDETVWPPPPVRPV